MRVLEWIFDRGGDLLRELFSWVTGVIGDIFDFLFGWL